MPDKTIITYHPKYVQYDLGEGHPYRGDRFTNAINHFRTQGLLPHPEIAIAEPSPATKQDLQKAHTREYIEKIFTLAQQKKPYDSETPTSSTILEAALLITGAAIHCAETIQEGKASRAISLGGGFHHAGRTYGGGFCLFNDIAVLIEYLRTEHNLKRFLVLDHDVHFGNGTSDIYYKDPTVLYISLHQDPHTIYPGTGFIHQTGQAQGEGYNVNVPLPPGTGDQTYLYALNEIFPPLTEEFKPEIIITNGGSDPHFADTLGNLNLTTEAFYEIATIARQTAQKTSNGKLILMPGSGYNPNVLPQCWHAMIAGATGLPEPNTPEPYQPPTEPPRNRSIVERTIDELKRLLRKHWTCFGGFGINTMP
jgi:acetoin utilization protein AcuC